VCRAELYGLGFIGVRRREQKVFYLATLSVGWLYSTALVLGRTTKQWWNDNDRGKPKYAEKDMSKKNSTFRAEPVTMWRICPFLVRYILILLVRVERKQMCGPYHFATYIKCII